MKKAIPLFLLLATLLSALPGCEPLVDAKKVLGEWVTRKDSTEMKVIFTPDSVSIAYLPGSLRYVYAYQWKQDEEPGLIECYQETSLHPESRGRKVIASKLYVLKVSADSISLFIPRMKTRFDLQRSREIH